MSLAKGIGSLIAGQLLGNTSLEIPGLFQYTAGLSCAAGLVLWICYQVFGKRYEKVIVENKQALVARLKEEKGGTKEPSKATLSVPGGEGQKEEDGDSIASMMKVTGSWGGRSMVSTKF